jgi:integrase
MRWNVDVKLIEVMEAYRKSRAYQELAPATKRNTEKAFAKVAQFNHRPIERLTKSVLAMIADGLTPGMAYVFITRMRAFMRFAVERDYLPSNPMNGMSMPKHGTYRPWTIEEMGAMMDPSVNYQVRIGIMLAYYTGQRISDVVNMKWSDIAKGAIYVRQRKTNAELFIPIHPVLQRALDCHPRNGDYILNMDGQPYDIDTFRRKFSRERDRLSMPKDLHFHGLRKTLACMLAAKGATTEQIKAVGGWKTSKQVDGYTRGSDQFALAKGALARLV